MAEEMVYPFFGQKERAKLEADGFEIVNVEYTPVAGGHGGDAIVTVQKNS